MQILTKYFQIFTLKIDWSTKFAYRNEILQKIVWQQSMRLKHQVSAEQIYGPLDVLFLNFSKTRVEVGDGILIFHTS